MSVLVVDDNATNLRIVEQLMQKWGMAPTLASSATEALAALDAAGARGAAFPLIVTDVDMPGMDGFALIEEIHRRRGAATMSIVMLSSVRQRDELARSKALGVQSYLVKPISGAKMLAALRAAPGVAPDAAPRTCTPMASASQRVSRRILLAEDNVVNQKVAVGVLTRAGHRVDVVENGREAIDALSRGHFDVVLMDVQMPGMGGLDATRSIRAARSRGRHVPIIALTARAMTGDREECLAAGMDAYVTKPLRAEDLLDVIDR